MRRACSVWMAIYALSTGLLQLVDLALDQVLAAMTYPYIVIFFKALSVVESLIGIFRC